VRGAIQNSQFSIPPAPVLQGIDFPPSTTNTCPVMKSLRLARKRTISAMSSGRPAFLSGVPRIIFSILASRLSPGKRIVPGATLFT